jgi:hypothetical protein
MLDPDGGGVDYIKIDPDELCNDRAWQEQETDWIEKNLFLGEKAFEFNAETKELIKVKKKTCGKRRRGGGGIMSCLCGDRESLDREGGGLRGNSQGQKQGQNQARTWVERSPVKPSKAFARIDNRLLPLSEDIDSSTYLYVSGVTPRFRNTETPMKSDGTVLRLKCERQPKHSTAHSLIVCKDACTFTVSFDIRSNWCNIPSIMYTRQRRQERRSTFHARTQECFTGDAEFSGGDMVDIAVGVCEAFGFEEQRLTDAAEFHMCDAFNPRDPSTKHEAVRDTRGFSARNVGYYTKGSTLYVNRGFAPMGEDVSRKASNNAVCYLRKRWCFEWFELEQDPHSRATAKEYMTKSRQLSALDLDHNDNPDPDDREKGAQLCRELNGLVEKMDEDLRTYAAPSFDHYIRRKDGFPCLGDLEDGNLDEKTSFGSMLFGKNKSTGKFLLPAQHKEREGSKPGFCTGLHPSPPRSVQPESPQASMEREGA